MEDVRLLVQEEGRAARNLIAFHVDVASPVAGKTVTGNRKPPSSPRILNETRMTKRSAIVSKTGSRVRSASTGRDKKSELQARYWAFLFGNLQRAVDEIYQTCESDESVSECKEVILVLENFTKDFHNLIEWFKLKWEYESTPPPQRPTSLAWEVRKSSPGKVLMSSRVDKANRGDKTSPVKKQLNFYSNMKLSSAQETAKLSENEQILSNCYGLSFGDVKEHLDSESNSSTTIVDKNIISQSLAGKNVGENKENCPAIVINNTNSSKVEPETVSNDQSSQTDTENFHNIIPIEKAGLPSAVVLKKPPPALGKATTNVSAKNNLSPLAVNKTSNSNASVRKSIPVSPTNTVPPRNVIPGRNVAATAFVPSKKVASMPQAKTSPIVNKSASNVTKTQNTQNQPLEKNNEVTKTGSVSLDTEKSIEERTPKEKLISTKPVELTKDIDSIKKTEIVRESSNPIKETAITLTDKETSNPNRKEETILESEGNVDKNDTEQKKKINESKVMNSQAVVNTDGNKDDKKERKQTTSTTSINSQVKQVVRRKVEKCDKCVMTDLPYVPQIRQSTAKVTNLVRNKTVPNFIRKSSETLSTPDTTLKNSTMPNVTKSTQSTLTTIKKQPSISEVPIASSGDKPAYSAVSKIYRSNTAIELRPKIAFNTRVTVASKYSTREKQTSSLQKDSSANGPLKNQPQSKSNGALNTSLKNVQMLEKKTTVDEDGWETVKGRSRWRLTQSSGNIKARTMTASSRFYLPSPATSLPALALAIEENEPEADIKPAKLYKEKQNQEIAKANKSAKLQASERVATKSESEGTLKSEKSSGSVRRKSKEDIGEKRVRLGVGEKKRPTIVRGKNDLKKDKEAKPNKEKKIIDKYMEILSSEDERINEEEYRKSMELYEEEKMLTKEIQDLEKAEIEVDTETDDAETDGETTLGPNTDEDTDCRITALKASYENLCQQLSWADQMETLDKLEELMAMDTSKKGVPMSERLATLERLEELVARHPGRALELHQKLSSPSRRRPLPDTIQRHRARQQSAQQKREQLLQDKSARMRELLNKVEEVKMAQAQLIVERKERLAEKLRRAEENRASHLRSIQRKAHDEEEKLREIAFINELEAQNKRHDFMALCQEQQERLQGILDERQRRQEEKAAKEAAVEERRRVLEAERQEKIEKMQERRRKREERIGREQQEKEKERLELAREKARDREERLQALQAAQLANVEELQKKILQKQFDSARRHEENIEHIRQRALESGALRGANDDEAPRLTPYDTHKLCKVCNVLIESEVYLISHLRGKTHQEAVKDKDESEEVITDAPPDKMNAKLAQDRERQKALRKRCKKIRSRMAQRGEEYLTKMTTVSTKKLESPNKGRLFKCLKDVDKLHSSQGIGQWPNNAITLLERNLGEISRILEKHNALDQKVFKDLNGFTTLSNILNLALDIPKNMSPYLPPKCFLTTCSVYTQACFNNPDNSRFVFFTNKIALVLDLLLNRLNGLITDDYKTANKCSANLPADTVASALMGLFALILSHSQENVTGDLPDMGPRLQDIISYTVSVGVVDKLALYCSSVRDPVDENLPAAHFLLSAIQLLTTLAQTKCSLVKGDPTQLVATLRVTELVGGVSMLYGMLLHQGSPPRDSTVPPPSLPVPTLTVTQATLLLLRAVAQLDLCVFQSVLGAEGMSLQLRHIASYLLWYCSYTDERELLHQVIEVVGYFAVNHRDNQMMLQSGHMPTVLQQLCNLPFEYFSDPSLSCHLFPTLLACCHGNADNRSILEQELSYQLLEDFKKSEAGSNNALIRLLK